MLVRLPEPAKAFTASCNSISLIATCRLATQQLVQYDRYAIAQREWEQHDWRTACQLEQHERAVHILTGLKPLFGCAGNACLRAPHAVICNLWLVKAFVSTHGRLAAESLCLECRLFAQ